MRVSEESDKDRTCFAFGSEAFDKSFDEGQNLTRFENRPEIKSNSTCCLKNGVKALLWVNAVVAERMDMDHKP